MAVCTDSVLQRTAVQCCSTGASGRYSNDRLGRLWLHAGNKIGGDSNALHCTALHCTALHCTALHCTVLHCTALHCTTLHCTALQSIQCILYIDTTQQTIGRLGLPIPPGSSEPFIFVGKFVCFHSLSNLPDLMVCFVSNKINQIRKMWPL
jgi:hypothetical protein